MTVRKLIYATINFCFANKNGFVLCSIELPNVQESDTTCDHSSTTAWK